MKKTYQEPRIEVIALSTEQRILDVSLNVLMATTPPDPSDPSNSMDMSAGTGWDSWN